MIFRIARRKIEMYKIISLLALSAFLALALAQSVFAQEAKPDLSFEDYKQIMKLADRVEAAVLIPDALLLVEITRPEHGLFLDMFSDRPDGITVYIPFTQIPDMFIDFEDKYWGGHDSADFDVYADIPSILLGVWGASVHLRAQYPDQVETESGKPTASDELSTISNVDQVTRLKVLDDRKNQ